MKQKKLILGCTLFLSGVILYGLRLIAATIFDFASKQPNPGINLVISEFGVTNLYFSWVLIIIGIILILLSFIEKD